MGRCCPQPPNLFRSPSQRLRTLVPPMPHKGRAVQCRSVAVGTMLLFSYEIFAYHRWVDISSHEVSTLLHLHWVDVELAFWHKLLQSVYCAISPCASTHQKLLLGFVVKGEISKWRKVCKRNAAYHWKYARFRDIDPFLNGYLCSTRVPNQRGNCVLRVQSYGLLLAYSILTSRYFPNFD